MCLCEDHEFARLTAWAHQAAKLKEVYIRQSYLGRFAMGMTLLLLSAFLRMLKRGASGPGLQNKALSKIFNSFKRAELAIANRKDSPTAGTDTCPY